MTSARNGIQCNDLCDRSARIGNPATARVPAGQRSEERSASEECTDRLRFATMNDAFVTFLSVTDLDESAAFYEGRLGLVLVVDQGSCRIYRVSESGFLGLCVSDRPVGAPGLIVTLVRDDVESYCAELVADGLVFERPVAHNERFGITHAFLRDPDGHLVEIQRFDDPDWAAPSTE